MMLCLKSPTCKLLTYRNFYFVLRGWFFMHEKWWGENLKCFWCMIEIDLEMVEITFVIFLINRHNVIKVHFKWAKIFSIKVILTILESLLKSISNNHSFKVSFVSYLFTITSYRNNWFFNSTLTNSYFRSHNVPK